MPRSADLHGNVPDSCPVALLLVDVINDLEFDSGDALLAHALPMAERVAALARRCRQAGIPVIYVNDNFGRWRSDFRTLLRRCLRTPVRGRPLARLLRPDERDYFVLKPKHSGFYSTTLELLLQYLGATTVILTGLTGDICVLLTAHDAYMRDLRLVVPADCVASRDPTENAHALRYMARVLKADTRSPRSSIRRSFRAARAGPPPDRPVLLQNATGPRRGGGILARGRLPPGPAFAILTPSDVRVTAA